MKFLLAFSVLALASTAFATDFSAKFEEVDCKIINGVVTRTLNFGKENILSTTETKTIKLDGLAPYVEKAIEHASAMPSRDSLYVFIMTHEGKSYFLNTEDSVEAMTLVRMISRTCL